VLLTGYLDKPSAFIRLKNVVSNFWTETIDLGTPGGVALKKLAARLPQDREFEITIFGSAALQMTVEPTLLSNDVDLFSSAEDLEAFVREAGLHQEQSDFYIQVCSALNFRTSPNWASRVKELRHANCTFRFPHPIDILIAKLNRLEEKDLLAFRVEMAKTGHPTERELIRELQLGVDLFRPSFDEEQGHDLVNNCKRLWPLVFGARDRPPGRDHCSSVGRTPSVTANPRAITRTNCGKPAKGGNLSESTGHTV
jgi:hypothetical protein